MDGMENGRGGGGRVDGQQGGFCVRTGGDGWSPVKGEGGKGCRGPGQRGQVFDVIGNGNQDIVQ